jgi:hypothetical protein
MRQKLAESKREDNMRLARSVFIGAGVWGILVLTPLYWLFDITGRRYVPPGDYPHFFYGFLSVAMAWQVAFLVIGSNPARFRPLMIPAILEKLGYVGTLILMYMNARIPAADTQPVVPDLLLGILFIVAFVKTRTPGSNKSHTGPADKPTGHVVLTSTNSSRPDDRNEA